MERIQRKPGFPVANCSIKMPDGVPAAEVGCEDDSEQQHRRQQLINFAHSQWGFNNWSWSVTKQDLDFVDFANGKYTAGVVAFVSISVKSFDIHRENIGYATSLANNKGFAIYKARKCAVTNALRETLLSFGGALATDLLELIESRPTGLPSDENNQNAGNKPAEPHARKEPERAPHAAKSVQVTPPVAKALPMPASLPPPVRPPVPPVPPGPPPGPRAPVRPGSNVSFVFQPLVQGVYGAGRMPPPAPPPHVFPNYYEYAPWHYYDCERLGNVNLNFNLPPRVVGRDCKEACGRPEEPYPPPQGQACWIKPSIFYDGFWTEQKVKKWVAEQVEKQFPEGPQISGSPNSHDPAKS